jgi:hypothetical protein
MSNNTKLKILCQRLTAQQFESIHAAEVALEQFEKLTTPAMVLGLLNDEAGFRQGADAEARAGDEARAEVTTLRAQLQVAEAGLKSAISTAQWQALTNKEMNAARDECRALDKEVRKLKARAEYWKQRAKSAEGHLFASDMQAACDAVHRTTNYADITAEQLTVAQKARISSVVITVLAAVNARRDERRPCEIAGVIHG